MARVRVQQGELDGVEVVSENPEAKYFAFKGIPYAKPPVGELRFKAPEPAESWQGVRDASNHGPVCPQFNERMNQIEEGSEDCLYLNVYTPNIESKNFPVMVWIHGGAFYTGSGNSDFYGPEFFMSQNVILVTINYRLEVLGFLCLDTEEVPGNNGLKDQVAALRWIKKNIASFGGDANNVTIFGCSAGAASTSYHLISKLSEGLFNKAICQSGVCLSDWSYNLYGRQRAFQLGKLLGKETEDANELLDFLKTVPVNSLVNIKLPQLEVKYLDINDSILFGPVIEKCDLNVEKFIAEPPPVLVKNGLIAKVPIIVGYTSAEGIEIARNYQSLLGFLTMPGSIVPRELKYQWTPEKIQEADAKIRSHYFGDNSISENNLQELVQFYTDSMFSYNIRRFARYLSKHSTSFVYKFVAETERNLTKIQYNMLNINGVCHSDDIYYLFHVTCLDVPLTEESRKIIGQFVELWSNFAKTGNPTPQEGDLWKPFTETAQNVYIIGENRKCVANEDKDNMKFWDEIYGEITYF